MQEDWQDILARNDSLKMAAELIEDGNRSFSGGTEYSFVHDSVETHSRTNIKTFIFDTYFEPFGYGWDTPFGGYRLSLAVNSHVEYLNPEFWNKHGMIDVDTTWSSSVGYVLSDDNIGDRFTVDVKRDGVFPSLVFDVLAGASSCPY